MITGLFVGVAAAGLLLASAHRDRREARTVSKEQP